MKDNEKSFEKLVKVQEAAWFLEVKESWLYQNHKSAGIPSYTIGRGLRFKLSELNSWLLQRTNLAR